MMGRPNFFCFLVNVSMLLGISRPLQLVKGFVIDTRLSKRIPVSLFSTQSENAKTRKPTQRKGPNTGGLRRLPVVKSPVELLNKSRREAQRVKANTYVKILWARMRWIFYSFFFTFVFVSLSGLQGHQECSRPSAKACYRSPKHADAKLMSSIT